MHSFFLVNGDVFSVCKGPRLELKVHPTLDAARNFCSGGGAKAAIRRRGCRGGPRRRAENGDAEVARAQWSRVKWPTVFNLDRYQSGIDHSLIDLGSGMVNWYLRIPLSSLILLSSSGAVFSRDPLHRTAPMLWKT